MSDRFERAGRAFAALCETMASLRAPGGCPWDREQTLESLKPYLIEEAYEALEAMDGPADTHRNELGDLLLQIVFQAEIAQETERFDIASVAEGIREKLVRRHPHVFGDAQADDAAGALENWEAMKAKERKPDASVLAGIPRSLPALLRALRTGEKAAAVGFDWVDYEGAADKVDEEWAEVRRALADGDRQNVAEEIGDLLFALTNVSRHLGIDPENTLRAAIEKFERRFAHVERHLKRNDQNSDLSLDVLNEVWEDAKLREREGS